MPPQQPNHEQPNPAAHEPEQYDFIMKAGTHRPRGPLANASAPKRIIIALGGLLALLAIGWAFLSFVTRGQNAGADALLTIAQEQTELARISQRPASRAADQPTRNFAQTTRLTLLTEQQIFSNYLQRHGSKIKGKALQATQNPRTDATLQQAQTNGNYDAVYLAAAQSQLTVYEHDLARTFTTAKLKSEKLILQRAYAEAKLLAEQSNQK